METWSRLSCRFFKVFLSNCSPYFLKEFQSFSLDIVFTNFSPVMVPVLTFKLVRITLIIWNPGLFYYINGFPLRRSKMLHHCVINIIINKIVKNKSCQRNTWFTGKKFLFSRKIDKTTKCFMFFFFLFLTISTIYIKSKRKSPWIFIFYSWFIQTILTEAVLLHY